VTVWRPNLCTFLLLSLLSFLIITSCQREKIREKEKLSAASLDYSCRWVSPVKLITAEEGEIINLNLSLVNSGRRSWRANNTTTPCFLSYHLLDTKKQLRRYDNPRYPFSEEIRPGQKAIVPVRLIAPLEPGAYFLEFDLVLEGKAWFKDYGSQTLLWPLEIRPVQFPEDGHSPGLTEAPFTLIQTDIPEFNRLQRLIRLTLKHAEVKFNGKSGEVGGFMAGSGYPQVWVRDSATIIPASRFYYPPKFLQTWLEEILSYQEASGSLPDWVDASGRTDKNTTESDQEASAVQAAAAVVRILGEPKGSLWLQKKIGQVRLIDRLQQALLYLREQRTDPASGLISGAHTADWGDVEIGEPDQRAIYADAKSLWTVDIYDQSMFYQAALDLASLWLLLGEANKAAFWQERAAEVKAKANELLWQKERGFYRVHKHIDGSTHDFNEDDLLALGGNTQAILAGLAQSEQARSIIKEVLLRRQAFGVSTISGCLLPCYPRGFFQHPMMDDPYEYQNGGQWDWFGGRMIAAMYEHGFSREATRCLLEVAKKNLERGSFFEWDTLQGVGRGSENYAGSAGALALALYEGFLGLKINEPLPKIVPRIGWGKAKVQVYLPASGRFYAYEYRGDREGGEIELSVNSNDQRLAEVKILWPWGKERQPQLTLNNQPQAFRLENIGDDMYVTISTDLIARRIEIKAR
jgi:hypothetical protein